MASFLLLTNKTAVLAPDSNDVRGTEDRRTNTVASLQHIASLTHSSKIQTSLTAAKTSLAYSSKVLIQLHCISKGTGTPAFART